MRCLAWSKRSGVRRSLWSALRFWSPTTGQRMAPWMRSELTQMDGSASCTVRGPIRTSRETVGRMPRHPPRWHSSTLIALPEPGWLEAGLRALDGAGADVVGGAILPVIPARPTTWTLLDLDLHVDQKLATSNGRALGGNLFVRRDLFVAVGGFDQSLPNGGDYDLVARCVANSAQLVYSGAAGVRHPTHDRPGPLLRKIWRINRAAGVRQARTGQPPRLITRGLIPYFGMAQSRKAIGRPSRLDQARLRLSGANASLGQRIPGASGQCSCSCLISHGQPGSAAAVTIDD